MNCQQIDEYIFAYCDENISPDLRSLIDEHLDSCEICQKKVELTRMENQILAEAADIPHLSEDFASRVMQSVSLRSSTPAGSSLSAWVARLGTYRFYIGGTAAVAVILLALYLPGLIWVDDNMQSTSIADRSFPAGESSADQMGDISVADNGSHEKSILGSASVDQEELSSADNLSTAATSPADSTEDIKQNLSPTPDNNKNIDIAVKRDAYLYGSSSLPTGLESAGKDSNESELDLLSLHPNNLPAEYKIEKIINTNYNSITYLYRNTANNEALEITVALVNYAGITPQSLSDTAGSGGGTDQEYLRSKAALLNSTNTSISYQGRSFEVNLKAVMPLEKLQELADSIKFEEGLPDEPID